MPLLTQIIPQQNFELVRDRIAFILADEIPNQAILNGDPETDARVFSERFVPFDKTTTPCINVMLSRGDYDILTTIQSDGTYTYFIDVYASARTTGSQDADSLATFRLHRIMGICRAILENPIYRTLAFAPPSIEHTAITDISIAEPKDNQDASSMMMGRLSFDVRVNENVQLIVANDIAGYDANIILELTDEGYVFSDVTI